MSEARSTRWCLAGLAALLALAWFAYQPGLGGGFHFDDYANLDRIAEVTPGNLDSLLLYLSSGTADPLGRPLSLLSFLANASDWPGNPAGFLRFNLALHLANGLLLFALLRQLGRCLGEPVPRANAAALLGMGCWLLHPLLASTTLYAVQREAMLPTALVLAGLLAYGRGRRHFLQGSTKRGVTWMVAGIALGTVFAAMGKANGLLLPLLALVLEGTVYAAADRRESVAPGPARSLRRWRLVVLWLPTVFVIAYMASYLGALDEHLGRPWTVGQRLLSEPRALFDYLQLLVVPRAVTGGLYNDGFPLSTGLAQPWTTLPALAAIIALLAIAVASRRRAPALSAALGFFFAAHLLESSIVPLELYFEHRNYLPALLLGWPLARWLCAMRAGMPLRIALAALLLLVLATTTWQRARLWGQPDRITALWLVQHPDSPRALASAAVALRAGGQSRAAVELLGAAWTRSPFDVQIALNQAQNLCALRGLQPVDLRLLGRTLGAAKEGENQAYRWLDQAIDEATGHSRQGRCPGLDLSAIEALAAALQANPNLTDTAIRTQNLESLRGRIALARGQGDLALAHFRASLAAQVRPEVAASQAWMLGKAGYHRQAMEYLDYYDSLAARVPSAAPGMPRVHAWLLRRQGYWPGQFAALRAELQSPAGEARARGE